jgi:hypothetical protein
LIFVRTMGSFRKCRLRFERPAKRCDLRWRQTPGGQLLDRTQANAISLTQGAIDRSGFGHAHLGVVKDQS